MDTVYAHNIYNFQVWMVYRGRADHENRTKEIKEDFGFDSFDMLVASVRLIISDWKEDLGKEKAIVSVR